MKLAKPFRAVPPGQIYPVEYQPGDECPKEHEASAREQGCFDSETRKARGGASRSSSSSVGR